MKIGMIGAGKVGFSLGKFFAQSGVSLTGYYSRNPKSAQKAAEFTDSNDYRSIQALVEDSDAIFITVPDTAISSVYREVSRFEITNKYLCHCSGALAVKEAFPDIEKTGAYGVSIHPLFPISSKLESYKELSDAFFCLEGDAQAVERFSAMLRKTGASVQKISNENKVRYHAACVTASNFMCALMQKSEELLLSCGFTSEGAREALAPLMRSNLEHLLKNGAEASLTGPIERGDEATVKKHLQALSGEEAELYRCLSAVLLEIAKRKHPQADYRRLEELLS